MNILRTFVSKNTMVNMMKQYLQLHGQQVAFNIFHFINDDNLNNSRLKSGCVLTC